MALTKSLIYLALALLIACSTEARKGRKQRNRGGRGSGSSESREDIDFRKPCWFENIEEGTVTAPEGACGDMATCDTPNGVVDINGVDDNAIYRVAFCKLNADALVVS